MRFPVQFVRATESTSLFIRRVAPKQTQQGKHDQTWFRTEKSDKTEILTHPAAGGQKHGALGVGAPSSTSGAPRTLLFSTLLTLTNAPAPRPQSTQSTNRVWSWFPLLRLLLARQVIFCADTAPHTRLSAFFHVLGVFLCFLSLHTLHVCIHVRRIVLRGRL